MGGKSNIKFIVDGKRIDGRLPEQARDIEMKIDIIDRADGSASVNFGNTHTITSIFGPRKLFPRFMQKSDTGILRYKYSMAPFSVDDRKRPGPDRRSTEISKVARLALEPAIFLEEFPKTVIDVFTKIIQADGSTRVTGINAASLALAIAGVPMRDMVTACSVGKVGDTLVVDVCGLEDNNSDADIAIAMMPNKKQITLLQMDGRVTKDEIMTLLGYAENTCQNIYEKQKETIKEKYKVE